WRSWCRSGECCSHLRCWRSFMLSGGPRQGIERYSSTYFKLRPSQNNGQRPSDAANRTSAYSGSVRSGRDSGFGIGRRLCFSFDGVKRAKDDSWGENFGQDFWRGARIGWVEDVCGDPTASQSCEGVGDGWVFAGPVGTDQLDSAGVEALLHVGAIEHHALVDLTAKTPTSSEIYKHRFTLSLILRHKLRRERLPLRVLCIDGGSRGESAQRPYRQGHGAGENHHGGYGCGEFCWPAPKNPSGDREKQKSGKQKDERGRGGGLVEDPDEPDHGPEQ